MSASRARRTAFAVVFSFSLVLGIAPAAAAADAPPNKPASMAATGDSITRAFNLCVFPFTDCVARSWSTGSNSTVNSHARRLNITASAFNDARSGAKMIDLEGQATTVASRSVGYVTVLMGGNDVCTQTEGAMTPPGDYEGQFRRAMNVLASRPGGPPLVYVVSIPNVKMLWEILKDNSSARSAWNSYDICQSLLANPLSAEQADINRRERVKQRNMELNQRLRKVCAEFASFCRFDGEAAFGTSFVPNDVSTRDYFHPSTAGQTKLAEVSYNAGYWGAEGFLKEVNVAPSASFTLSCPGLTCTITNTTDVAGDVDGVAGWSWHFGDGSTSTSPAPGAHTFAAAGNYTVTLYAIDGRGATSSMSQTVTVADGGGEAPVGTLTGTVTVAGTGSPLTGATVSIDGTGLSDTTDESGGYVISGAPPDTYQVTAAASGYASQTLAATVTEGGETVLDFQLAAVPKVAVGDLDGSAAPGRAQTWTATVTISVVDGAGTPVSEASVAGTWTTSGGTTSSSCVTQAGACSVQLSGINGKKDPSVNFTVDAISRDGYAYAAELNDDPETDSDGTTIIVSR